MKLHTNGSGIPWHWIGGRICGSMKDLLPSGKTCGLIRWGTFYSYENLTAIVPFARSRKRSIPACKSLWKQEQFSDSLDPRYRPWTRKGSVSPPPQAPCSRIQQKTKTLHSGQAFSIFSGSEVSGYAMGGYSNHGLTQSFEDRFISEFHGCASHKGANRRRNWRIIQRYHLQERWDTSCSSPALIIPILPIVRVAQL